MKQHRDYRAIRKIVDRHGEELAKVLPLSEYKDLICSYSCGHNPPSEIKMRKDLRYLKEKLGLRE